MASPDQVLEHARGSDLQLLGRGWGLVKRQLGRARKEFFIGFFGALLFAGATIGSSYVIGWVTDEVLVPSVQTGDIRDRKSTRLNSSHSQQSRMPSSA